VLAKIATYPEGTRIAITAPIIMPDKRRFATQLEVYRKAGYSRLLKDDEFLDIEVVGSLRT